MKRGTILLNHPERYSGKHVIPAEKIQKAIKKATDKFLIMLDELDGMFPPAYSKENKYPPAENITWTNGMHTGAMLLAYELTGNERFLEHAKKQMASYYNRLETKTGLWNHDVGFVFTPSCIALYSLTGDEEIKSMCLEAAEFFYENLYSQKGGFIIRSYTNKDNENGCRTMMDTLMNIPILFWAHKMTGEQKYLDAANSQLKITEQCLIREDGSSFHHYLFDVETHKPVRGLTFQGHSDDSCWSRGHSWGVYGFPVAYSYNHDESLLTLHRDVCYFMLNHMPASDIPYYDYDFVEPCDEALDASAGLISACGMLEACKYLPDDAPEKAVYQNAAAKMIEAVLDNCMDYDKEEYDGLINGVTCSAPHNLCINGCTSYGDFFLLEALIRYTRPDWKRYW